MRCDMGEEKLQSRTSNTECGEDKKGGEKRHRKKKPPLTRATDGVVGGFTAPRPRRGKKKQWEPTRGQGRSCSILDILHTSRCRRQEREENRHNHNHNHVSAGSHASSTCLTIKCVGRRCEGEATKRESQ